jgi:hypothetical protein
VRKNYPRPVVRSRLTASLLAIPDDGRTVSSFAPRTRPLKGYEVATLAQNKIFPAKQELLLSEITGLPLDAQMQWIRLDVDERVEGM